jgi:hypothetical protein
MKNPRFRSAGAILLLSSASLLAQQTADPMQPASRAQPPAAQPAQASSSNGGAAVSAKPKPEVVVVPAGTRLPLILRNAVSSRNAKAGDPVYLETNFPVTIDNQIVIPVGSYVRGEILQSKRPGKVKGTAELRMRLNTMIFPNGYTVDFNALPTNAEKAAYTDSEGNVHGDTNVGGDVGTVAKTTGGGAVIGAIADGAKGAGIGAGIGGALGLGAVLLTRGPELNFPPGTSVDVVLDHPAYLEADRIGFGTVMRAAPMRGHPQQ